MAEADIASSIARVRERIARAAERTGRKEQDVTLVAVSKRVSPQRMAEAQAAGIRDFGESYVQEALGKIGDPLLTGEATRFHFIGHLQSNKVRDVVGHFALIQSVDSPSLATEISRRGERMGTTSPVLLEIKLDASADAKFGFSMEAALEHAMRIAELPAIEVRGLMGMAPFSPDPERARPYFRQLYRLFEQLPEGSRHVLSMGMSGDFETAVEEGATLVRIGTAIFGKRT